MKFVLDKLKLSRQALLFDSYLYVLKGFLSVFTGYTLFHNHPIMGKDMISLLFGMMLTLEPVNIIGIKAGFDQIKSSILGGVITAALVAVFGVNIVTIPLGVALTMYFALKLNWRFVSPVAIFTAIYMTQYIQFDALGNPSMWITFRLRLLALGSGIGVAIFYNYLFSMIFHNGMLRKRVLYIVESLDKHLGTYIKEEKTGDLKRLKADITGLFADIDQIIGYLTDIKKVKNNDVPYERYRCMLSELRDFTHYFLDVIMYRMRHDVGMADIEILKAFQNLLIELQKTLDKKSANTEDLKACYQAIRDLNIAEDSYLSSMHNTIVGAVNCYLSDK